MHTLSYVNNAQAALHEVARVLEPGGKFIFLVRRPSRCWLPCLVVLSCSTAAG